ncbi:peptidyl-prolyl cis-trans isomerase, rhodopsin-specific isozyme [Bradysia coprophila]|uniref:peptidyl-prolyl cis-trans isomerase, rhodopsin-specific isozyme n=1 Tax=Bradysia coprophila TaxID=38358 RepID=UPI00187D7D6D|nr:peptidyl-prolyl cis-trans isomerase, rhodopsin-specific isozyme [Bradysia coprophila]
MNYFVLLFRLVPFLAMTNATLFKVTSEIYMDFAINHEPIGRLVFGLFEEEAPKTVKNFREICVNGIDGQTYAGSSIHRVIDKFIVQGGDIVSGDGLGSVSIYGKYFEDENLEINHTGPGFIGMANRGPDTNGCQFYITTMAAPWLNGKHTIFGKVVRGHGNVHKMEKVKTDMDDFPVKPIEILSCGIEPIDSPYTISDEAYDVAAWLRASAVPLGMSFSILALFHYIIRKLNKYIGD